MFDVVAYHRLPRCICFLSFLLNMENGHFHLEILSLHLILLQYIMMILREQISIKNCIVLISNRLH